MRGTQKDIEMEDSKTLTVRYVEESDRDFWFSLDHHLSQDEFRKKVRDRQGYVLLRDGTAVGILRYNMFWDNTPFCNLLYVAEGAQRQGCGQYLMEFWEQDMKGQGFDMVMTSTQADEQAQHFYRRLGYEDCGCLLIHVPAHRQPTELFFLKQLEKG